MDVLLVCWWLVAGWCGSPGPGSPQYSKSKKPLIPILAGLIGGVIGGGLFVYFFPLAGSSENIVFLTLSGLPALIAARIISDIFAAVALGPQPEPPD